MRDNGRADVPDTTGSAFLDEATLRALIEHVPITVYIDRLDETGSNVYTSPRLESELGYTAQEWVSDGELYGKVLHPEDRERILAEYRRTRDTDEPFRAEYRMIARDGTVHWFHDEAAVIRDETGRPAYFHGGGVRHANAALVWRCRRRTGRVPQLVRQRGPTRPPPGARCKPLLVVTQPPHHGSCLPCFTTPYWRRP